MTQAPRFASRFQAQIHSAIDKIISQIIGQIDTIPEYFSSYVTALPNSELIGVDSYRLMGPTLQNTKIS
jgi:hypothetical protein